MSRQIHVNLPVKDLNKSVAFFTQPGFTFNPQFTNENATCMIVAEDIFVMLLVEEFFLGFTDKSICDARKSAEVMLALSCENRAEEAVNFYVSVFKHSGVLSVQCYGSEAAEASGRPEGSMMTTSFLLDGQEFVALNGGPVFKISPAVSFVVNCDTQAEVDEYWQKLTEGGEEVQCGWLTDQFGVSWQIVPAQLGKLLGDPDKVRAGRVWQAMLQMKKIDIAGLERAYEKN